LLLSSIMYPFQPKSLRMRYLFFAFVAMLSLPLAGKAQQGSTSAPATTPHIGLVSIAPGRFDLFPGTTNSVNLSYDSAFRLAIHIKPGQVLHVASVVTLNRGQDFVTAIKKKNVKHDYTPVTDPDTTFGPVADIDFVAGEFKPGKHYALYITEDIAPDVFTVAGDSGLLQLYYAAISKNDSDSWHLAQKGWSAIRTKQANALGGVASIGPYQPGIDFYKKYVYKIHTQYFDLEGKLDQNRKLLGDPAFALLHASVALITSVYPGNTPVANTSSSCSMSAPCDSTCKCRSLIQGLYAIAQDKDLFTQVLSGVFSLDDVLKSVAEVKPAKNIPDQLTNVSTTLKDVQFLRGCLFGNNAKTQNNKDIEDIVQALYTSLVASFNDLKQLADYKQQIFKLLIKPSPDDGVIYFSGADLEDLNAYIFNFQTRTNLHFTPIFGYAVYKFGPTYDFSPYLGFQVNIEPMNLNTNFADIRYKSIWQRLAFMTAWTLKSVAYPGKRSDFFGNSSSLLTGIGFKFSHFVMINASALWFKDLDPNPYSTRKNIVCVPSLSLSINLSIPTILNGFTSLIPAL